MNITSTNSDQPMVASKSDITPSPLPSMDEPKKASGFNSSKQIRMLLAGIFLLLLVIGGGTAFYLTQVSQDLRQQASTVGYGPGYECNLNDPNACNGHPERCHCLGGDACTGTECDPDIEESCRLQGRSYCTNYQGQGTTCCVAGYECCSDLGIDDTGCCRVTGPTRPPGTPPPQNTPTIRIPSMTVTPTRSPSITPTRTPTPTQGPSPTPTRTPTPTPTGVLSPTPTVPGPQCYSIGMYDANGNAITGNMDQSLTPGTPVKFSCSATGGTPDRYEFRVLRPDGVLEDKDTNPALEAVGSTTGNYALPLSGSYLVQCRICVGATCHPYESLPDTFSAECGGDADLMCPEGYTCNTPDNSPDAMGSCELDSSSN